MDSGDSPNRESIMEAVVVAFRASKLKDVVGADAFRSVIEGQYRDMVSGGKLHLQVIWELIHGQPGYDEEAAPPPFCALKRWEKDLRLEVLLPETMAELSATEIIAYASHCAVSKQERQRIFRAGSSDMARSKSMNQTSSPADAAPATRRPRAEAALALVAAAALGFAIYSIVGLMSGPSFEKVKLDEIGALLPIQSARKLGTELHVRLSDDSWLAKPAEEQNEALSQALTELKASKIDALIVQDSSDAVRASAQWKGTPPTIEVRLH